MVVALTELELVARVLRGDSGHFETLMRRYNQRLFRAARAILRDNAEAEDVVQQAWLMSYQHLAEFRGEAAFGTWVTRIVVNEALARRRSRARHGELSVVRERSSDAPEATPEEVVSMRELGHHLESLIDRLPESYRVAFVLRDVEEMSTAESAQCLGISEEAVRVRLHRARHLLQEMIIEAIGAAAVQAFRFDGDRCDRIVRGVLAKIGRPM